MLLNRNGDIKPNIEKMNEVLDANGQFVKGWVGNRALLPPA